MSASAGYTLLELLLATAITIVCGAVAFSAAFGARELYDADAARNALNQTLRSATDMVATEVRETGERLPPDFPALELVDNAAGDRLTLRRHLVEVTLQSCTSLAPSATRIFVGLPAGTGNCSILADNDSDGYPDNIQEFRAHRLQYGVGSSPTVLPNGYIYDPTTKLGEYFSFENEELDLVTSGWILRLPGGGLTGTYPSSNQPRVYIVDETRYDLNSETIEVRRNGDAANPLAVVDGITDFQVTLLLDDSSSQTSFTVNDDWTRIRSVQLQMTAHTSVRNRLVTRTLTADVLPRNVLSY